MKIYRANLIDTPTKDAFRIIEHGYLVVDDQGRVVGVYDQLPAEYTNQPVTDYGDKLLIPAFNDLHLHAPQYRNSGIAMDLELLPWLNTYTFPEESKFSDTHYAQRVYSRFVHDLWKNGTMRSAVFATIHPQATRILADLFLKAGMLPWWGRLVWTVTDPRHCPIQPKR